MMEVKGGSGKPGKRKKVRTRAVRSLVKAQLEKLFCAGGLERNKKLKTAIEQDLNGYVDLSMIRAMFGLDTGVLSEAGIWRLGTESRVFEVSEDGKRVRQRPDVATSGQCTIFVDSLPTEADETWLVENFEKFGTVARAEVPKPRSHAGPRVKNRGFGFVEFVSVAAAKNACEHFGGVKVAKDKDGSGLGAEVQLNSGHFSKGEASSSSQGHLGTLVTGPSCKPTLGKRKAALTAMDVPLKSALKRKITDDSGDEKRVKLSSDNEPIKKQISFSKQQPQSSSVERAKSLATSDQSEKSGGESGVELDADSGATVPKKKKHRVRLRRKLRSVQELKAKERRKAQMQAFTVLPLVEWRRLREEYLALQKSNMQATKQVLKELDPPIKIPEGLKEKKMRGREKLELRASLAAERALNGAV